MSDDPAIPAFCIISPEDRKAAWARYDAAHPKEATPMGEKSDQVRDLRIKRATTKGRAHVGSGTEARKATLRAMVKAVDAPKKMNLDQALARAQGRTLDAALLSPGPICASVDAKTVALTGSLLATVNIPAQEAIDRARADGIDFTAHRHPCLAVACPDCKQKVGSWCIRPSGHPAGDIHKARREAADVVWEKYGLPTTTQVGPEKFVYDLPDSPAGNKESDMKTAVNSKPKKTAKKPASRKPAAAKTAAKAKTSASANARTPVKEKAADGRPDGLRKDSKQAKMIDFAVAADRTEAEICKHIGGWKACAVTLRRVCEKIGAKLTRVDGKFHVELKPQA